MAKRRKSDRAEVHFEGFTDVVEIGGGGFSTVYSAREIETSRKVALKLLNVRDMSEYARETFRRETTALGILSTHPNIVTLYRTLQTSDGLPVLVMELCKGTVGDDARRGLVAPSQAVGIAVKVAGALETAHRSGMLHQDVKPQNLLVTEYGQPALADFGVARLQSSSDAAAGVFGFTTLHAAPELLEGAPASAATDVYELASTLYQLLAGRAAFRTVEGEAPAAVILRILRDPVRPLTVVGVPTSLSDLLVWSMDKDPANRPSTAIEFAELLQGIERSEGWPATSFDVVGSAPAPPDPVSPLLPDADVRAPIPSPIVPASTTPVEHAVEVTSLHPDHRMAPPSAPAPAATVAQAAPAAEPPPSSRRGHRTTAVAASSGPRTCACGTTLDDGDRFCQSCGTEYIGTGSTGAMGDGQQVADLPVVDPAPAVRMASEPAGGRPRICALGHPVAEDASFCETCGLPYPTPQSTAERPDAEPGAGATTAPPPPASSVPAAAAAEEGVPIHATSADPVDSGAGSAPEAPPQPVPQPQAVPASPVSAVSSARPAQPLVNGPTVAQPIAAPPRQVVTPVTAAQTTPLDRSFAGPPDTGNGRPLPTGRSDQPPRSSGGCSPRYLDPEYAPVRPPATNEPAPVPVPHGGSLGSTGAGSEAADRHGSPFAFEISSPADAHPNTDPLELTTLRPGSSTPSSMPEDDPETGSGLGKLFKPLRRRPTTDPE